MVFVFICEGILGIILHILLHVFTDSATGKLYYRFVKCLSFSDILFCVALLALAFSDMNFGFSYPIFDSYWRKNFTCYCVSVLVYIGTTFSIWSVSFIALIRYYMVEKPLKARYKNPYVWKFCICVVFSFVSAIGLALVNKFVVPEGQLPTRLCLLFGGTDLVSAIAASIVIVLQLFAAILVPTAYSLLTITVLKQTQNLTESSPEEQKHGKLRWHMLITCTTHMLHWMSYCTLLILTLTLPNYPTQVLDWMLCLVVPIEILTNPFIYGLGKKSNVLKSQVPISNFMGSVTSKGIGI